VEKDVVIDQDKKQMRVKENSTIQLTVSNGAKMETMRNYVGQRREDVEAALAKLKLKADQVHYIEEFSEEPPGTVIAQDPAANTQYHPQQTVFTFTVSKGQKTYPIPDLIGKKETVIESILTKNNLKLDKNGIQRQSSYSVPEGYVIRQFPEPGDEVASGEKITVWISNGFPQDAREPLKEILVEPAAEGQPSQVKILVSDAVAEQREYGTWAITDAATIPVKVVVSPEKSTAIISYYRDGNFIDSFTVTYQDALQQNAPRPAPLKAPEETAEGRD
jgi:serine/threonine-protein kinase